MIHYDRSYCLPFPLGRSPVIEFFGSKRAAKHLLISDRHIRTLARHRKIQAYYDPAIPKLLYFRKTEIFEYSHCNPLRRNEPRFH